MSGSQSPARYEIRVQGVLDQRWTAWFEGLQVTSEGSQTVICGPLPDQPALHGVLIKVRDLGMCLISVRRLDPEDAGEASLHEPPTSSTPIRLPAHEPLPAPAEPAGPARPARASPEAGDTPWPVTPLPN